MKLITKVNLIKKFKFTPEQIKTLEKYDIPFEFENKITDNDVETIAFALNRKLDELILNNDEEKTLLLSYLTALVEQYSVKFDFENDEFQEEYDEIEDEKAYFRGFTDDPGGLTGQEQGALQRIAVVKYLKQEKNTITLDLKNYILEKCPLILNGFNISIYSNAKRAFWQSEHIFNKYAIPISVYEKIKEAEYLVEGLIKEDILKHSKKMYPVWESEYKTWLKNKDLNKSTKSNVKDFFKSINVKPTETIIERIKETYTNE